MSLRAFRSAVIMRPPLCQWTQPRISNHNTRCLLFSTKRPIEAAAAEQKVVASEGGVLEGAAEKDLGNVRRHGAGDACIILNVGGKEFMTLRSTVNSNPVLADHVARAEANREVTKAGAIFIDRDPTHFQFILNFLRNKVEMLSYSSQKSSIMESVSMSKFTNTYARLPSQDRNVLSDLYLEATYYRIPELQDALSKTNWFVKITDLLGDGNPFDAAAKWAHRIRAFVVSITAFSTLGGSVLLMARAEYDTLLKTIGLRQKEDPEEEVGWLKSFGLAPNKKKKEEQKHPSVLEALNEISAETTEE